MTVEEKHETRKTETLQPVQVETGALPERLPGEQPKSAHPNPRQGMPKSLVAQRRSYVTKSHEVKMPSVRHSTEAAQRRTRLRFRRVRVQGQQWRVFACNLRRLGTAKTVETRRVVCAAVLRCQTSEACPCGIATDMSAKKTGSCPKCGADCRSYRYPKKGRFKHCYACGFDRLQAWGDAIKKRQASNGEDSAGKTERDQKGKDQ